jgi:hypothetical protein
MTHLLALEEKLIASVNTDAGKGVSYAEASYAEFNYWALRVTAVVSLVLVVIAFLLIDD